MSSFAFKRVSRELVIKCCEQISWSNAEMIFDALEDAAGAGHPSLHAELIALRFVVARLCDANSAMRIGHLTVAELEVQRAPATIGSEQNAR